MRRKTEEICVKTVVTAAIPFDLKLTLTSEEAAAYMGLPATFITRACRKGHLRASKSHAGANSKRWVILKSDFLKFLNSGEPVKRA